MGKYMEMELLLITSAGVLPGSQNRLKEMEILCGFQMADQEARYFLKMISASL